VTKKTAGPLRQKLSNKKDEMFFAFAYSFVNDEKD